MSCPEVSLHAGLTGVAARVFMVPLPPCDAALTSRVIRNVSEAVRAESLGTHALWALPGAGCPSFFYFFLFQGIDAGTGRRLPGLPRDLLTRGHAGAGVDT